MKVVCFSIVPSPYQRDLFFALSAKVDLRVYYLEAESPDSPWPQKPLASYESIIPGSYIAIRGKRFFFNWKIPSVVGADVIILNGYAGIVFQWILRFKVKTYPCFFWGERMVPQSTPAKKWLHRLVTAPLKRCAGIVAIGSKAQADYRSRFPGQSVFNIPYFCDLKAFQDLPLKKERKPLNLLFCGQMIRRKGLDVLLNAFELLSSRDNVLLHLVGREAELNEMLLPLSRASKDKIIYHGFQAPEKLPDFFDNADVFILPSRYDGWGVVVNQALGAGLPIICSDQVGAGLDLVEEGKNGYIFQSGSVDDLYDKMKTFLDHPEQIVSMSAYSRAKSAEFTPELGAMKWLGVLNQTGI